MESDYEVYTNVCAHVRREGQRVIVTVKIKYGGGGMEMELRGEEQTGRAGDRAGVWRSLRSASH